jgi:hypothetical protein
MCRIPNGGVTGRAEQAGAVELLGQRQLTVADLVVLGFVHAEGRTPEA